MAELRQRKGGKVVDATDIPSSDSEIDESGKFLEPQGNSKRAIVLIVLGVLGVITRCYRVDYPNEVVFDEVHFGSFTNSYLKGEYFFDIHPPLGKLLLYAVAWVAGNDPSFGFDLISDVYPEGTQYVILRAFPAMVNGLTVPLMFLNTEIITKSSAAGIVSASMYLFDMAFMVQSRYIMIDSFLFFFIMVALYFSLRFWNIDDHEGRSSILQKSSTWWLGLVCCGLSFSAALGVKMTGLATAGIFSIRSIGRFLLRNGHDVLTHNFSFKVAFNDLVVLAVVGLVGVIAIPGIVYYILFVIHIVLLPKSGEGDAFMSYEFQGTLEGSPFFNEDQSQWPSMFQRIVELNKEMVRANSDVAAEHPWATRWYSWPALSGGGVLFWVGEEESRIYLLGNPMVWWLALGGSIIFLCVYVVSPHIADVLPVLDKARMQAFLSNGLFLVSGIAINWLPFIPVKRPCFLYHYLPALSYSIILFSMVFAFVVPARLQTAATVICVATLAYVFYFFSPLVYGFPVTSDDLRSMQWLSTWD